MPFCNVKMPYCNLFLLICNFIRDRIQFLCKINLIVLTQDLDSNNSI